ncbi:MAG: hypothetical protein H7Y60_16475 [Rhodospirillaceae bacterium]|nr:hypothetical protein [Rhodospirillales bacterium]
MIDHIQINDVTPRIHYHADGVQAAFTYPFAIFKETQLEVWLDDRQQNSGFTVSGAGSSGGGAVIFAVAPAAATQVTLRRRLALERLSDYQADGIIRAKTLNDELDYQVAAIQQVAEELGRTVKRAPASGSRADLTLPEPVPGRSLKWNDSGTALTNSAGDFDAIPDLAAAIDAGVRAQQAADTALAANVAAAAEAQAALDSARAAQAAAGMSFQLAGLVYDAATDALHLRIVDQGEVTPAQFDAMTLVPSSSTLVLGADSSLHLQINA